MFYMDAHVFKNIVQPSNIQQKENFSLVKYGGRSTYIFELTEKITEMKKMDLYYLCVSL